MSNSPSDHHYIVQYQRVGAQVKVTAMDPVSLKEVSVIAPVSATKDELNRLVLAKLNYMLKKNT